VTTQVAVRRRPRSWALTVAALGVLVSTLAAGPASADSAPPTPADSAPPIAVQSSPPPAVQSGPIVTPQLGPTPSPQQASTTGAQPIYFGDAPLASVLPNGSDSTEYTTLTNVVTGPVVVSPDRTQVAWEQQGLGGLIDVDVADLDGMHTSILWAGTSAGPPVWASDGSALAFVGQLAGAGPGVFLQPTRGGDAQFIPSSALAGQFEPTDWSADGATLVGMYTPNTGCDGSASVNQVTSIALLRLTTNTVTTLTHDCHEGTALVRDLDPEFSPDGTQVVFIRYGATQGLDRVATDGSDRKELLTGDLCCTAPAWSPDGTQLAYYSDLGNNNAGIYVANADGTNPMFIAPALHHPAEIQWGVASSIPASSGTPSGTPTPSHADTNAPATATALSANPAKATVPIAVTLTASVQVVRGTTVPVGKVIFTDTTTKQVLGTPSLVDGSATISVTGMASGDHEISVAYQPADAAAFAPSSSPNVEVQLSPAVAGTAPRAVIGDDPGGLTITTPYGPQHPLNLGPLVLDSSGLSLVSTAVFGCASDHVAAIQVTDDRSANANWSAYISSTDFTDRASNVISAEDLGLTGVTLVPVGNGAGVPQAQTAQLAPGVAIAAKDRGSQGLKNGPHMFATTTHGGNGSVGICGTLTLTAPTSTPPGVYTANLTLTIG
jgi:Tol biopolymer transport system component